MQLKINYIYNNSLISAVSLNTYVFINARFALLLFRKWLIKFVIIYNNFL